MGKSESGTGIGLFISKSIIETHDSKIEGHNNLNGNGASFKFTIPLTKMKLRCEFRKVLHDYKLKIENAVAEYYLLKAVDSFFYIDGLKNPSKQLISTLTPIRITGSE